MRFDRAGFLDKLAYLRNNAARSRLTLEHINSIVDGQDLAQVTTEFLESRMIDRQAYNIYVTVPDPARQGLDQIVMSCHTDGFRLSLRDSVGPGVNDNGTGVAILLEDLERVMAELEPGRDYSSVPKTTYLFFSGEEGSLKGIALSVGMMGVVSYGLSVGLSPILSENATYLATLLYSLGFFELMSRSNWLNNGLSGSTQWARKLPDDELSRIKAGFNLDMVGLYARSNQGWFKGLVENFRHSHSEDELRTVIIPDSNISTNPVSWLLPIDHSGLSSYLSEITYAASVASGLLYNIRSAMSLGSSDHASIQAETQRRNDRISTALMIGLEGAVSSRSRLHTSRDTDFNQRDMEFTGLVAKMARVNYGTQWKSFSQLSHLADLKYIGLFAGKTDYIIVARSHDRDRDMFVNMMFRADQLGMITLEESNFIGWNLESEIVRKGMLKGYEEYHQVHEDYVVEYCGIGYSPVRQGSARRRLGDVASKAADFVAQRQIVGLAATSLGISIGLMSAMVHTIEYLPNPYLQLAVAAMGTIAIPLVVPFSFVNFSLHHANVIAESMYDLSSYAGNHHLSIAHARAKV
jgi:hypothetical protein